MRIIYSVQIPLGKGFGLLSHHIVDALQERGYEITVYAPRETDPHPHGYDEWHDMYVSLHMGKADAVIVMANAALDTFRKAKTFRAKCILQRGSAHIRFQEKVLAGSIELDPVNVARQMQEYELADIIVVDSSYIKETFARCAPHLLHKVRVVNLGVNIDKFKPAPLPDKFTVLFVGGNYRRKGLKYLIEAWQFLKYKDAKLRIIGMPWPDTKTTKFINHVPDIVQEYQNASVLCLPSLEDGWGMVCTEAAACGRPVIISENTGCKDILKDGESGIIVPPRDVTALWNAIHYFHNHPEAVKKMGENARKVVEKYTWEKYKKEFIQVMEECL